ncbi:MAG: O-antigen ligase family protein [Bacteroidota bacterium]|nr:O-antigen ligase family protein [Bacteroidota bacterium]
MRPNAKAINPQGNTFVISGLLVMTGITMAGVLAAGDIGIGSLVAFLPVLVGLIALIISNPYFGLLFYIHYSFFFIGLNRYVVGLPLGLSIDAVLFLATLSMLFRLHKDNIRKLNNGFLITTVLWFIYTLGEAFNPEAGNLAAWVYAVRGLSFYAIQTVPLTLLLFDKKEHLDGFIKIIIGWGIIGAIWGWKQINIGLDPFENGWLESGGKITHVLGGQLRAFSFFSDAGQFGVTMAYAAFLSLMMALGPNKAATKFWYIVAFIVCIIGMGTSGSRGPVFVIFFGLVTYLLLVKNYKILVPGISFILIVFVFLKFTFIGNSNYQVYRIRTALDPNEASLLVRLSNQDKLREYLKTRPFGAGIGTTDSWALRFYPNSYLVNLPTDSWFVKVWVENGVVGLSVYALGLAFVIVMGVVNIRKVKNPDSKQKLIALYGGFLGIVTASFGNPVFGQAPLGALMYISMTMLSTAETYDEPEKIPELANGK